MICIYLQIKYTTDPFVDNFNFTDPFVNNFSFTDPFVKNFRRLTQTEMMD